MITVNCPACQSPFRTPDQSVGQQARCPHCQAVVRVGQPPIQISPPPQDPFSTMWPAAAAPGADPQANADEGEPQGE